MPLLHNNVIVKSLELVILFVNVHLLFAFICKLSYNISCFLTFQQLYKVNFFEWSLSSDTLGSSLVISATEPHLYGVCFCPRKVPLSAVSGQNICSGNKGTKQ